MLDDSLEDLVRSSHVIVIATPESPLSHIENIYFDEGIPPYQQNIFHYRVIKSLLGDALPGSSISVIEADTGTHQDEHHAYHARNMTMCIAWQYYTHRYEYADTDPRILFLWKDGIRYAHVNHTGQEGVKAEEEVLSLLEGRDLFNAVRPMDLPIDWLP